MFLGSVDCSESVNGFTTAKNKKSQRIKDSKQESSSDIVNGKKNESSTKQVEDSMYKRKIFKGNSSSFSSSLNELQKEIIISEFFDEEKKAFEKDRKQTNQEPEIIPEQKTLDNVKSTPQRQLDEEQRSEIKKWNVLELEDFFKNIPLPTEPVKLDQCTTITDIFKFVDSHISVSKVQNGNLIFKPYFDRLVALKEILINEHN